MRDWPEPGPLEMVRTIALARLISGREISVQAPPNLTPEAYQFYLLAGIDDWGGVSPVTRDHINPEQAWPKLDELRAVTAQAGYELRERLAIYPRYVRSAGRFLAEPLRAPVAAWADELGLVRREDER